MISSGRPHGWVYGVNDAARRKTTEPIAEPNAMRGGTAPPGGSDRAVTGQTSRMDSDQGICGDPDRVPAVGLLNCWQLAVDLPAAADPAADAQDREGGQRQHDP